ncbi:MAG: amino acid ABC transporter permease, partial [Hyphomicrobium sp.]|nr:amino acid ABC transporter permease [Hyphomicrobium sp.]
FQLALAVFLVAFFWWIANNTITNLKRANIASGFGFLGNRAGFEILTSVIPYSSDMSYGRAFVVGLLNTLYVAILGIIFATILGFVVGIARLSRNWIIAKIATVYVEFFRNIPLLLQLLFWYKAVLSVLPGPRQSFAIPGVAFLSNRGLIFAKPYIEPGGGVVAIAFVVAIVICALLARWAKRRFLETGQPFPVLRYVPLILLGLPLVVGLAIGARFGVSVPELAGFNFRGGASITPVFLALMLGLVVYTAAFIAEIVRAGILAVSHGQTEASSSLGLDRSKTLRLVVVPQAMRVIIPPLTNQYLNLTKNSSLAVAIGYPDLVSIFAGTVLNQTGQAVEVIMMTMAVYLTMSLLTSAFMNWFNSRIALKER